MQSRVDNYVAPSTAGISAGQQITSAGITNLVQSTNGVNAILNQISHNVVQSANNAGSPYTITANQDTLWYIDTTGGNVVINLPSISGNKKSYRFVHIAGSGQVQITRNGADTIDNPWQPTPVPTATDYFMYFPGESVELFDDGNYWRCIDVKMPAISARAGVNTAAVTITQFPSFVIIPYNSEYYDYGNSFNTSTFRYTCPVDGLYYVRANILVQSGASSLLIPSIYLDGSAYSAARVQPVISTDILNNTITDVVEANKGQIIDIRAAMSSGTRNTFAAPAESNFNITLLKRLG